MENLARILEGAAAIVRPPPDRNAWQWADECRILPDGSGEPGPWKTSRVPYCFEPYEAASDPECQTLIIVMGSQMSKTEFELNIIGHRFSDGPYVPALYVGPTQKQVSSMSRDRFAKMFDSVEILKEKMATGQEDKITEKFIGGIRLGFGWAGSATELSSHPAGLVVVDERDRMDDDVAGEGDPVELVRARLATYANRLLVVVSTPTVDGQSPIISLFDEGTKKRWYWRCLHCGEWFLPSSQLLKYPDVTNDPTPDYAKVRAETVIPCPECGGTHTDQDKDQLNQAGKYFPHSVDSHGNYQRVDITPNNTTWSYWVSGLASPWVTWGESAELLSKVLAEGNQGRVQTVINTRFGEVYRLSGEAPDVEEIRDLIIDLKPGEVPGDAQLLTAGCDVQKDGIFWVIRSWAFNDVSHLVDHGFIFGETEYDDVWIVLQGLLSTALPGGEQITRAFVDSGYAPGVDRYRRPAHMVYAACKRSTGLAHPTKGLRTMADNKPLKTSHQELRRSGHGAKPGTIMLWLINTDYFKTWIRSQITIPEGAARKFTVHNEVDNDYCEQMIAEHLVVEKTTRKWICARNKQNHYFDCEVLARAAALSVNATALKTKNVAAQHRAAAVVDRQRQASDPRLRRQAGALMRRR